MSRAKGKLPQFTSAAKDIGAFRAIKLAKPECREAVETLGKTEYTTGPCQQAVAHQRRLAFSWYKTCTHGPLKDGDGNEIEENLRPYYEEKLILKKTPIENEDGVITDWQERMVNETTLRVVDVALSNHTGGPEAIRTLMRKGLRPLKDFDFDEQYCEHYGCFRTETKKFTNGYFCSREHAVMVKARETGMILAVPLDIDWTGRAIQARQQQLASLDV